MKPQKVRLYFNFPYYDEEDDLEEIDAFLEGGVKRQKKNAKSSIALLMRRIDAVSVQYGYMEKNSSCRYLYFCGFAHHYLDRFFLTLLKKNIIVFKNSIVKLYAPS